MGKVDDFLSEHLHGLAGPYLFVGAGLSRRYVGLGDWKGLLTHFADLTGQPFAYYLGAAGGDFPMAATLIADAFYDSWWSDAAFTSSVDEWRDSVTSRASPLKFEVARYVRSAIDGFAPPAYLLEEFELFKDSIVDGVITTNFDSLLEHVFPDFRPYVGQDELVFSDTQGIAEIYYIHGGERRPNSLVLTAEDYEDYNARNAYLAAKLATIFVEHPVIFLGYSLGDSNIQALLDSLITGLRPENVSKLQDRLIFVEWVPDQPADVSSTVMNVNGVSLPIIRATVPNFLEVFSALGQRERAMPARILRLLKEQVFELVQSNDPDGRLVAVSDIDDSSASGLDVVFGVGAKMTAVGIVGLTRQDLFDDVLQSPARDLPADLVISKVYPKFPVATYVPVFKYLVEAGLWTGGSWQGGSSLETAAKRRADRYAELFAKLEEPGVLMSVADLEANMGWDRLLNSAMQLPRLTNDVDGLRAFLMEYREKRSEPWWSTQYAKAVVAYDWMRFGRA
ncbi:SIR2 family protein [Curtobacterium sp. PsM8]|uniref:SIR2 family protein n=1 Tax=Curtobacterium sp. PsM8 TaxID=3030532 RepID=UPI00263B7C54|nr:SIR2 family protein [Curtobacterium sp. PsM8]MDN4647243.1 SIR2 family protein [Curtobacterium sp. PsM8]